LEKFDVLNIAEKQFLISKQKDRNNEDIENMLRAWMKDNKTKKWSIGLQFIQFQKNSSHHRIDHLIRLYLGMIQKLN